VKEKMKNKKLVYIATHPQFLVDTAVIFRHPMF
jgi:hypothetical protein